MARSCERLLLLVGGNPMPNYVATLGLHPKEVCLVSSEQTKSVGETLQAVIQADFPGMQVKTIVLRDANDGEEIARKVGEEVAKKPEGTHLNYTGGTKLMSAYALQAFYAKGGERERASYLDSRQVLIFDRGEPMPLQEKGFRIPFESLLRLHGIQATRRKTVEGSPTIEDAEMIARRVLEESFHRWEETQLLKTLQRVKEEWQEVKWRKELKTTAEASRAHFEAETVGLPLSEAKIPLSSWPQEKFQSWSDFLGGLWLEDWVEKRLEELQRETPFEVRKGLLCQKKASGRTFEVDLVILRGVRLYAISCTTSRDLALCKLKAFEVIERTRQMGGDLATSAVICPLWGSYLDALKADVKDEWGSNNPTKIFGRDDLWAWSGFGGKANLTSLRAWIK